MAFSSLTNLTEAQYNALAATFDKTPSASTSGSPDTRVTIALKGWTSDTVLAFSVTAAAGSYTSTGIETDAANTLDIDIYASLSNQPITTYWTLDVGSGDSRNTNWAVYFAIEVSNRSTGKWVFRKGMSEPNF